MRSEGACRPRPSPPRRPAPCGHGAAGARQARVTSQPTTSAARNGHAVCQSPAKVCSPWLARPIAAKIVTRMTSSAKQRAMVPGFDSRVWSARSTHGSDGRQIGGQRLTLVEDEALAGRSGLRRPARSSRGFRRRAGTRRRPPRGGRCAAFSQRMPPVQKLTTVLPWRSARRVAAASGNWVNRSMRQSRAPVNVP